MGNEFDLAIFCETEILVQVRTDWPQYHNTHLSLVQNPAALHQFRSKQAATKLVYVAASNIFPGKFLHTHNTKVTEFSKV